MTTLIKTQCPSCQALYDVSRSQLDELEAKLRCKRCQQIFLINDYTISNDSVVTRKPCVPKQEKQEANDFADKDNFVSSDILIYDDMPIDDSESTSFEFDSLDEMDIWTSPLKNTASFAGQATQSDYELSEASENFNAISGHGFVTTSSVTTGSINEDSDNTSPTLSSAAKNNIHASISNHHQNTNDLSDDNAWLEKLLEEQSENLDSLNNLDTTNAQANPNTGSQKPHTDLSQLLTSMGVPVSDQNYLRSEATNKDLSRFYPKQNRVQTSAASLLWVAGCLVLVMLLFAQYVIFNLDHLIKNPAHAERLQAVCAIAACSLPSADMSALEISNLTYKASEIKPSDEFSDISATLVNQSAQAQLLPSLKVSIYGNETLAGEFIALPEDYLASTQYRLSAQENKAFMFTIPIKSSQIAQVAVDPIY